MADRTVSVRLRAEISGYIAGMSRAGAATQKFANDALTRAEKQKKSFSEVGLAVGAMGGMAALGVGKAVSAFADFDQAMSNVNAVTKTTGNQMDQLRALALNAGQTTQYSAVQAADGIGELAKAGVSVTDILNGGLTGALSLAAAGQISVADASEVAATTMTQFGLSGSQVGHVADLLAAGADKAVGSVGDLGEALSQVGTLSGQMGISVDETVGVLAAFASNAMTGSEAGSTMKMMLMRLAAPTGAAKDLLDQMGVSLYDANGHMVTMSTLAGELQKGLGGMSEEQRNAAMSVIFGARAIRGANVLYKEGASGIADWTHKVNDQGFAAENAAKRMDNLHGDLTKLKSAFQTALIETGGQANGVLRNMAQEATHLVNAYTALPDGLKAITLGFGGAVAIVGTFGGGLLLLIPRIAATKAALIELGVTVDGVGKAIGGMSLITATAMIGEMGIKASWVNAPVSELAKNLRTFGETGKITGGLANISNSMNGLLVHSRDLSDVLQKAYSQLHTTAGGINSFLSGGSDSAEQIKNIDQALAQLVTSGHAKEAADAFQRLAHEGAQNKLTLQQVQALFPSYGKAVKAAGDASKEAASKQAALKSAVDGVAGSAQGAKMDVNGLRDAIKGLTSPTFDLRSAQRGIAQALDDATKSIKDNGRALSNNTAKGRANQAALDQVASSANDLSTAMYENGASMGEVQKHVDNARSRFVALATQMGMDKGDAKALARELINVPDISPTVTLPGMVSAQQNVKTLTSFVKQVPDFVRVRASTPGAGSAQGAMLNLARYVRDVPNYKSVRVSEYGADGVISVLGRLRSVVRSVNGAVVGVHLNGGRAMFASGGYVSGPGTSTSDSIPAMLSDGEFVMNAKATRRHRQLLEAMNGGQLGSNSSVSSSSRSLSIGEIHQHYHGSSGSSGAREGLLAAAYMAGMLN